MQLSVYRQTATFFRPSLLPLPDSAVQVQFQEQLPSCDSLLDNPSTDCPETTSRPNAIHSYQGHNGKICTKSPQDPCSIQYILNHPDHHQACPPDSSLSSPPDSTPRGSSDGQSAEYSSRISPLATLHRGRPAPDPYSSLAWVNVSTKETHESERHKAADARSTRQYFTEAQINFVSFKRIECCLDWDIIKCEFYQQWPRQQGNFATLQQIVYRTEKWRAQRERGREGREKEKEERETKREKREKEREKREKEREKQSRTEIGMKREAQRKWSRKDRELKRAERHREREKERQGQMERWEMQVTELASFDLDPVARREEEHSIEGYI